MRLRLSTKLVASIVLVQALMLGILVWNSNRQFSSSHAELLQQHSDDKSKLLATTLAPALAANDRAVILDILSLLKDSQSLTYVMVYNHSHVLMGSIGDTKTRRMPSTSGDTANNHYKPTKDDGVFDIERKIFLSEQHIGTIYVGYSTGQIESLVSKTRIQNTTIAALAILISMLFSIVLGIFLTRNLRKLEEGAEALKGGNLSHRIKINSHHEKYYNFGNYPVIFWGLFC